MERLSMTFFTAELFMISSILMEILDPSHSLSWLLSPIWLGFQQVKWSSFLRIAIFVYTLLQFIWLEWFDLFINFHCQGAGDWHLFDFLLFIVFVNVNVNDIITRQDYYLITNSLFFFGADGTWHISCRKLAWGRKLVVEELNTMSKARMESACAWPTLHST